MASTLPNQPVTVEKTQPEAASAIPAQSQTPAAQQFQGYQPYQVAAAQSFQPYQPYQSYPQPGPGPEGTPETLGYDSKSWSNTKFGAHAAIVVVCIIGLGLSLSFVNHQNIDYGLIAIVGAVPVFAFALAWSVAELITRCVRKQRGGIHPGAHIALHLIIWGAAAIIGGAFATYVAIGSSCDSYYPRGYYDSDEDDDCLDRYGGKRIAFIVITVFLWLLFLAEFMLFVAACADTHKRNVRNRQPMVVYQQVPYWPVGQGQQPPAQPYYIPQPGQQPAPVQPAPVEQRAVNDNVAGPADHQVSASSTPQPHYAPGTAA